MLLEQDKLQANVTEIKVYKRKTSKDKIKYSKNCVMDKPVQYIVFVEKWICSIDEGYRPTNALSLNACPHGKKLFKYTTDFNFHKNFSFFILLLYFYFFNYLSIFYFLTFFIFLFFEKCWKIGRKIQLY